MTNSLNCSNQQPPSYSGVTINITNPAVSVPQQYSQPAYVENGILNDKQYPQYINRGTYLEPVNNSQYNYQSEKNFYQNQSNPTQQLPAAYPQQYYINNYNNTPEQITKSGKSNTNQQSIPTPQYYFPPNIYTQPIGYQNAPAQNGQYQAYPGNDGYQNQAQGESVQHYINNDSPSPSNVHETVTNPIQNSNANANANGVQDVVNNYDEPVDTTTSNEIIEELDKKNAEQKELEKNGKKVKIVSLTNEYIMSLENYLNNPNTDIRLMAAKEILTRLDEDKSRYDDAALNALLNKMLQDPEKLIRIAAMSAFSSELASGNDYTVQLLNQIQQNPNADPEDVLEASQILLKRSTSTEIRYTPQSQQPQMQPQITPEQIQQLQQIYGENES